jgi:hypothetical protein
VAGTHELTLGGQLGDSHQAASRGFFFRFNQVEEVRIVESWHGACTFAFYSPTKA